MMHCYLFIVVVDSNDTLYGHDGKFLAEIAKIGATIIDGEILAYLRTLSEGYEVFYCVINRRLCEVCH